MILERDAVAPGRLGKRGLVVALVGNTERLNEALVQIALQLIYSWHPVHNTVKPHTLHNNYTQQYSLYTAMTTALL